MKHISAVVSAYNEEDKIVDCLKSLAFCDEVILVDNSSTDQTVMRAKPYVTHIYTRKNNRMLNINKNYGFSKATGEWILNLDGDERVSPHLQEQILAGINATDIDGYNIPRRNIIFGKWIQHTGWYPDYQLRLFKRNKGKFAEKHIHELVTLNGVVSDLTEPLDHENYQSMQQFMRKSVMINAPEEARSLIETGYVLQWTDAFRMPLREFLSRFFAREGYKDGFHGLMLSLLMGFYHFMVFAYVWEETKYVEAPTATLLADTESELLKAHHDTMYWFLETKLNHTKSTVKKSLLKLKYKLS